MIRTIILTLILCAAVAGFAEEQKAATCDSKPVAADQVPAAAVATLTKLVGGTAPTAYIRCVLDGKDVYCVTQKGADGAVIMYAVGVDGVEVKDCGGCCSAGGKVEMKCCSEEKAEEKKAEVK